MPSRKSHNIAAIGSFSVPGGTALAQCAGAAMQEIEKRAGMDVSEVITKEDYEQQRTIFLAKQEEHAKTLQALQEQAQALNGKAELIEQIKKAQDSVDSRVTALEKEMAALKNNQSGSTSGASSLIQDTWKLAELLKLAERNTPNIKIAKTRFDEGEYPIFECIGKNYPDDRKWKAIKDNLAIIILKNIETISKKS